MKDALANATASANGTMTQGDAAARATARQALLAGPVTVWTNLNHGTGSGLDADLLDGISSEAFLKAIADEAHARATADVALDARISDLAASVPEITWTTVLARDGATSGLNADLLDDLESSQLLRSDQSGRLAGHLTVTGRLDASDVVSQGPLLDVRAFGALGDGENDDTAALQAAIDAAPVNGTVLIPPPPIEYRVTGTLRAERPVTLLGQRSAIRQTADNTPLLEIRADDVWVKNLRLVGPSFERGDRPQETAIDARGPSGMQMLQGLRIEGNEIERWGFYAVYLQHVRDFRVADNRIADIFYAGIMASSVQHGFIGGNSIRNIEGVWYPDGAGVAYGIAITRGSTDDLAADPRSSDVLVTGNVVDGVPKRAAYVTKSGERIAFVGNVARNTRMGVMVGGTDLPDGAQILAPLDVTVVGNVLDSGLTGGSARFGISFVGAMGALGAPVERATGSITGNVIRGYGDHSNPQSAAVSIRATQSLAVTGNTILEPSPIGINVYHDNDGITVTGNSIVDPWTNSPSVSEAVGIYALSDYNNGLVTDNHVARGAKQAARVLTYGIRVSNTPSNSITLGVNAAASEPAVLAPGDTTRTRFGARLEVEQLSNTKPTALLVNGAGAGEGLRIQAGGGGGTYAVLDAALHGGTSLLLVRGDGNVGIGTPAPAAKLHVAGHLRVDGSITANGHLTHLPWWNLAQAPEGPWAPGYVKLITPIAPREENFFSIQVVGYRYGIGGTPVTIRCNGYAYAGAGLLYKGCNTEGTSDPVGIGVEDDRVVITIGSGASTWYFDHFTAEYLGDLPKNAHDFRWEWVSTSPPPFADTNRVKIDDEAGTINAIKYLAGNGQTIGDVAEPVQGTELAPGDVVVSNGFDAQGKLQVKRSDAPLSPKVVGVVSTNPSLTLAGLATDTPLAVTGIVPVNVVGPIAEGALLTTSAIPGRATACKQIPLCHGSIIGKALEPFEGNEGTLRMIISLG